MVHKDYSGFRIEPVREVSWRIIVAFIILDIASVAFINLVVFPSGVLDALSKATFNVLNPTLTANVIIIVLLVYLLMIRLGKLTWADLGIKRVRLLPGIAAFASIWAFAQLVNMFTGLFVRGAPVFSEDLKTYGLPLILAVFASQVFGNCLFEEMAFRGFLMPQLGKKLKAGRYRITLTVLLSQTIFGLIHIPNRIYNGTEPSQMFMSIALPAALGILFAVIYLVTDNLFLAIGIHALINMPVSIFAGFDSSWLVIFLTIILLIIWPHTFGRMGRPLKEAPPKEEPHV